MVDLVRGAHLLLTSLQQSRGCWFCSAGGIGLLFLLAWQFRACELSTR
ncbi:MAG: hypothetical protein MZV49_17350 [Rhodopseudomonas palustris]|nr:hypothetical protein [Rhodopseudomonas palustris]